MKDREKPAQVGRPARIAVINSISNRRRRLSGGAFIEQSKRICEEWRETSRSGKKQLVALSSRAGHTQAVILSFYLADFAARSAKASPLAQLAACGSTRKAADIKSLVMCTNKRASQSRLQAAKYLLCSSARKQRAKRRAQRSQGEELGLPCNLFSRKQAWELCARF